MTKKEISRQHEEFIAGLYDGRRSPSSGASAVDKGDVRVSSSNTLFECKAMGEPGRAKRTALLNYMEKAADEAYAEGKEPAVALRMFAPDSPLSGHDGWVDFVVRLAEVDASR